MSDILAVDSYSIPGPTNMDRTDVKVVLVRGAGPDCAAYRGIGEAYDIASFGDKITLARAELHFPGLVAFLERDSLTYRED